MNEQTGQSLSAMLDGEADDLDIERLCRALDDVEMHDRLQRFSAARSALGNERTLAAPDFVSGVMDALANEPLPEADQSAADSQAARTAEQVPAGNHRASRNDSAGFTAPLGKVALAATVALAVVFGFQYYQPGPQGADIASAPERPITAAPVAGSADLVRQRMQPYIQYHTEHSAVASHRGPVPMARMASYAE